MRDQIQWIALVIWLRVLHAKGGRGNFVKKLVEIRRIDLRGRLRSILLPAALAGSVLFVWACGIFEEGRKPVIKTYDGQWESIRVNNAIVEFIIEQGYGYPAKTLEMTSHEMQEAMELLMSNTQSKEEP